jgi:uncharacterized protein (TIGR00251 family)
MRTGGPSGRSVTYKDAKGITPMPPTVIRVKVKPNARVSALTQLVDGSWVAQVKAPAIEGRANKELIALVAEHFQCVKAAVSIKTGKSKRLKVVSIAR